MRPNASWNGSEIKIQNYPICISLALFAKQFGSLTKFSFVDEERLFNPLALPKQ